MARKSLMLFTLMLILSACGTIATPVFEQQLQETRVAEAATSAAETAAAPTSTPTITPSSTPTDTPTPLPTDTPTPTNTPVPPTDTPAPTEVPTEASSGGTEPTGDPANGQVLFTTFQPAANFACNTCHLVDSEAQLIGPGLLNVSVRAETRIPGMTAEEYLRDSILHPSDYVVEGYPDLLMPQNFGEIFTDDEINDLVAYLFTLKG